MRKNKTRTRLLSWLLTLSMMLSLLFCLLLSDASLQSFLCHSYL